jgi:hypothetical protein
MTTSFAILELDRHSSAYPSDFAAVLIRANPEIIFNTTEVRGSISRILKSDYIPTQSGRHKVFVRSSGLNEDGTVYILDPLV